MSRKISWNICRGMATSAIWKADWSLTSWKEKLIKTGAKVVSHGRYVPSWPRAGGRLDVVIADGGRETWLVRFDKNGVCSSPKTRDALLDSLSAKKGRPVLFFSHGWNNDFADAVDLYRRFLFEFEKVLAAHAIAGISPIFVGVTWPSIWLPSDAGPQMAAGNA